MFIVYFWLHFFNKLTFSGIIINIVIIGNTIQIIKEYDINLINYFHPLSIQSIVFKPGPKLYVISKIKIIFC